MNVLEVGPDRFQVFHVGGISVAHQLGVKMKHEVDEDGHDEDQHDDGAELSVPRVFELNPAEKPDFDHEQKDANHGGKDPSQLDVPAKTKMPL